MNTDAAPIVVDPEPIPGTRLHRRARAGVALPPEYITAKGTPLAAIEAASAHGFGAVAYKGKTYVRPNATWYRLNFGEAQ